jgi:hypothetical protein
MLKYFALVFALARSAWLVAASIPVDGSPGATSLSLLRTPLLLRRFPHIFCR